MVIVSVVSEINTILKSLLHAIGKRTKWKRQNQLRLEQLRHQASIEKELISASDHSSKILTLISHYSLRLTKICHFSPFIAVATSSLSCCPTSLASFSATNPCTSFLTSAAAAALFRNVSYVHGCPL